MSPGGNDPEVWVGQSLGRHRVIQRLGTGGMAHVYLAEAEERGGEGRVAIKMLRPEHQEVDEYRLRFEREAKAAGRVRHPNVTSVGALSELPGGGMYFVMELLEGLDLADTLIYSGSLKPSRAVAITGRMAAGLAAAHQAGVVHRDVKPENVFLVHSADGRELVKILDFGFAWMDGDPSRPRGARITANLSAVGTPEYMAPEQVDGVPGRPAADIYSLGVVLFELLTGQVPFAGSCYAEIAYMHAQGSVPSVRRANVPVSEALDAVVSRALQKRPEERFPSMFEMIGALRATPEGAASTG